MEKPCTSSRFAIQYPCQFAVFALCRFYSPLLHAEKLSRFQTFSPHDFCRMRKTEHPEKRTSVIVREKTDWDIHALYNSPNDLRNVWALIISSAIKDELSFIWRSVFQSVFSSQSPLDDLINDRDFCNRGCNWLPSQTIEMSLSLFSHALFFWLLLVVCIQEKEEEE